MTATQFDHRAWLYDGLEDLARRVDAAVASATAHGDGVLVCVDQPTWGHLVGRLGALADAVTYVPADVRYARPTTALGTLVDHTRRLLDDGAGAVWSIGEIDMVGSDDPSAWVRYEAAANEVLAELPIHAICLFDLRRSTPAVLDAVHRTHPRLDHGHGPIGSAGYLHPRTVAAAVDHAVRVPASPPVLELGGVDRPADARGAATRELRGQIDDDALGAVVLVLTELVTNAVEHAGTPADVALWRTPDAVVLRVVDRGPGHHDPFPELRPPGGSPRGRGLWIVGQLSERVRVDADDAGTVVTCVVPTG